MIKPILLTLGLTVLGANAFAAPGAVNDLHAPAPVATGFVSAHVLSEASAGIDEDAQAAERLS